MGLRTGGRRAKGLKNRVKSSEIELRFREVRSQSSSSRTSVLKEIIFSKREYQEKPDLQGLQKLWNVVRWVGNYIVCNTYAAGMQQIYQ